VPVGLNHTIVATHDQKVSATFMAEILGLPEPEPFGHFLGVHTDNGVALDFMDVDGDIHPQHYAFLITEDEFDAIFGRIHARCLSYWADPMQQQEGRINTRDGGRGVYFQDPDGHLLEVLTRPYGSGG
jgi:catechol 2,3-dioxygenase-like lactoylglutathione lyase family enzyme